jgi:hypothetical protein
MQHAYLASRTKVRYATQQLYMCRSSPSEEEKRSIFIRR